MLMIGNLVNTLFKKLMTKPGLTAHRQGPVEGFQSRVGGQGGLEESSSLVV